MPRLLIQQKSPGVLSVDARIFFDTEEVTRRMDRREKTALTRIGAYGMRVTRNLLNKKTKGQPSRPGEPPRKVLGTIKRFTFFGYDAARRSVVVGPTIFGGSKKTTQPVSKKTVPQLLEQGGRAIIRTTKPKPFRDRSLFKLRANYPARPWVEKAMTRTAPFMRTIYLDTPL